MKILIVDDSRVMRKLVRGALEPMGNGSLEIVEASDGLEALQRLEQDGFTPDLVLADWTMPRMDGITFVRLLRSREALKRLPVVMLTSQSQQSQKAEAADLGVAEYILKPFDADVLREKVLKAAAGRRGGEPEARP
jgi:two-component system chemotaxis response regulator CheY